MNFHNEFKLLMHLHSIEHYDQFDQEMTREYVLNGFTTVYSITVIIGLLPN